MAEEFLQEIKEAKHTDDPHDSANKEALDGYISIDVFKPKSTEKVKRKYSRETGWV